MNQVALLASIRKNITGILSIVAGVVILFVIYKLYMRMSSAANAMGGMMADNAENKTIAKQFNIPAVRIGQLRQIALLIAKELETWKDMGWLEKATNLALAKDLHAIWTSIKSAEEMIIVKNFYEQVFTLQRSLYNDVQSEFSDNPTVSMSDFPFIAAIMK